MKTAQDYDISYTITSNSRLNRIDESKHITFVNGSILVYDENKDMDVKIGSFDATFVKMSHLCDSDEHPFDVIDQTQSITDVANAVLNADNDYDFKESVNELFDNDLISGDFVIIESVELDPEWRGSNIGLAVIRDFIKNHIETGTLVVVEPAPLTKDVKNETRVQVNKRVAKLNKHWKKLGFLPIGKTGFYGFATSHILPEIEIGG